MNTDGPVQSKPYANRTDLPEHEREISAEALEMLHQGIAAVRAGQVEPLSLEDLRCGARPV